MKSISASISPEERFLSESLPKSHFGSFYKLFSIICTGRTKQYIFYYVGCERNLMGYFYFRDGVTTKILLPIFVLYDKLVFNGVGAVTSIKLKCIFASREMSFFVNNL